MVKEYVLFGIHHREDLVPTSMKEVIAYIPQFGSWDVEGRSWVRRSMEVMERAGLHPLLMLTQRSIVGAHGTGPGGALRLGDNWLPHVYRLAVPLNEVLAAEKALLVHNRVVGAWRDDGGVMPVELPLE